MKKKILFPILFLMILFSFSSCVMHYEGYGHASYGGHYHGPRHHFGNGRHHSVRSSYWGKHRYGHRPYDNRGRYQ